MRTSRRAIGLVAALVLMAPALASAGSVKYRSALDALYQGMSGYNGGYYEIAIPALDYAVRNGSSDDAFLARFYLARIYADNSGARTNHTRAYELYQRIVAEHTDVDPDDDQRAPFVAKALTALAGYIRTGLPEAGVQADAPRAAEYLQHAASVLGDEDAQFELAKLQLKGEGIPTDIPQAKHWLATLSQKGHAGAQAFLADLYWRGKFMGADHVRALALITIAVANSPPAERVWIEDIYQNIYCGASMGTRKQATGLVADWRTRYGRKPEQRDRDGLSALGARAERTCKDGEPVAPYDNGSYQTAGPGSQTARLPGIAHGFVQGSTSSMPSLGLGYRPAGEVHIEPGR